MDSGSKGILRSKMGLQEAGLPEVSEISHFLRPENSKDRTIFVPYCIKTQEIQ